MSLQIVYGRSGTGKTSFCLNEIKKNIKKEDKLLLITPEQFSFNAEKSLLEILENGAFLNAEVLSFKRMAYRILNKTNSDKKELTKTAKAMLVYYIMQKSKDKLKLLSNSKSQDGNSDIAVRSISEFKRHGITAFDLINVKEKTEDKYLQNKIEELAYIYNNYEELIKEKCIDQDDNLSNLAFELENNNEIFKDAVIWIDEFTGFTKQEYKVIEKLLKICKKVTVSICSDGLEIDEKDKETDIFYTSKKTINKLINLAKENKIKVEESIELKEKYRYKSEELRVIEENLFDIKQIKFLKECKDVSLYLAQDPYSEIEYVAKNIAKLVSNTDINYKDISVVTKSKDTYFNLINVIFKEYNIPVFMDLEEELASNILIKYVMSVFDIFITNWSYESVFNYLKTGFTNIEKDDICILENYVLKWGIKGSNWYKDDWKYEYREDANTDFLQKINSIRKKVIKPILNFKSSLDRNKTVRKITTCLYNFLIEEDVYNKLNKKIEFLKEVGNVQIANEYSLAWNSLINIFDDFVLVLGEEKIDFEKYKNILKYGINQNKLSTIPATLNQVVVGDAGRSRSAKVKVTFIIGLNDSVFPTCNNDEGFINDEDRTKFKELGYEIAKDTKEQLYEDEYNIYKAFTTAEEKLFLSFPTSSNDGKTLRPSTFILKLKKIFFNLKEKSFISEEFTKDDITTEEATFKQMLFNIRKWKDGEEIDKIWFALLNYYKTNNAWKERTLNALKGLDYTNKVEKIDNETIEKLYGDNIKTSISKLELYNSCAFSYYLKYGLRIEPREEFTIENVDIGSFMHNIIDYFFQYIDDAKMNVKEISIEECNKIVEEIIEKVLNTKKGYLFSTKAKYVALSMRLKKAVSKALWIIICELKNSEFKVART